MTGQRRGRNLTTEMHASLVQASGWGATWRRVDLHLHSPGVASFVCPHGADLHSESGHDQVISAYVGQLCAQHIAVGAITDYNGVRLEWFEPLAKRAAEQGITLLPGVELSFNYGRHGLHILAIFSTDTNLAGLNTFLLSLDKTPVRSLVGSDRTHRDIDLKVNLPESLNQLKNQFNCLLIFPHPDQTNGFCKSLQAQDAAKLLLDVRPDAIEHCSSAEKERLQSTAVLPRGFWDHMAFVQCSDPKRIEEIGTKHSAHGSLRTTYLKLSATDLDALRLALHDPQTRLALRIPPSDHAKIRKMRVAGSGFLGNLDIDWNDDLDVIIGGRGAGKSAILETLRYALDMQPYSDQTFREELVRHALGSGGKVEITLERPLGGGQIRQYRVTRVLGEDPRAVEVDTGGLVAIPPSQLLGPSGGPTVFGQREIYGVSASEEYRIALLDDLIGEEARSRAQEVRESIERLRANARSILDVRKRLAKRDEHVQRLSAIEHEIGIYEKLGAAEKLKEATRLRSDGQALRSAAQAVQRLRATWIETIPDFLAPLDTAYRAVSRGQSQRKDILEEARRLIDDLRRDLKDSFQQLEAKLGAAEQRMKGLITRWQEVLRPLEEEINRIKQEAQTEALDPDRLLRLTEERTAIQPIIEELNQSEQMLKDLLNTRRNLLADLRDRRYSEHQLRRQRADEITELLEERLRLAVEFKGQKEEYKKQLAALVKGSGVSEVAIEKLVAPDATDGIALAEAVLAGPNEAEKRFGLTPAMAQKLVSWLTHDESRLFEAQTLIPADTLRVQLKVDGQFRPIDRLSAGQRATAILLLLFALEGRVLVLDQPEDDLDNRFVYEDVVQILRTQKGLEDGKKRRQIIAATHNANIPVLGDAELVLALEARENRSHIVGRASIDDRSIRDLVKSIMEGGEEAFRRRAEKYGGPQASV